MKTVNQECKAVNMKQTCCYYLTWYTFESGCTLVIEMSAYCLSSCIITAFTMLYAVRKYKYREFTWHGMHHTISTLLVSFFYSAVRRKTTKCLNFQFISWKDLKFQLSGCVLIFLPLSCNLVMWYELIRTEHFVVFQYHPVWRGNQHGCSSMMTYKNLLDMTSHVNPLFHKLPCVFQIIDIVSEAGAFSSLVL